jgi:hypothetical protein
MIVADLDNMWVHLAALGCNVALQDEPTKGTDQ